MRKCFLMTFYYIIYTTNERIWGTTKVGGYQRSPGKEIEVMRREEHYVGSRAMEMKVQGRRREA